MPVPQKTTSVKTTPAAKVSAVSGKTKTLSNNNNDSDSIQTHANAVDNPKSVQEISKNTEPLPNTAYIANIGTIQDSSQSTSTTTKNINSEQNPPKTVPDNSGNHSPSVATNRVNNASDEHLDDILAANGLIVEPDTQNVIAKTTTRNNQANTNLIRRPGSSDVDSKSSSTGNKTSSSTITSKRNNKENVKDEELRIQIALAKRYYNAGKFQNAIDLLESPSVNSGADANFKDLLLLSYMKYAGQLVTKAELLEAQTILEKAIEIEPNNKELKAQLEKIKNKRESDRLYRAGLDALNVGDENKAFKAFQHVLELYPDHKLARQQVIKMKSTLIEDRYKEGMQYYRKQELNEAIKAWDDVLALDPDHELSKLYRARAVELKRKLDTIDNL